MDDTTKQNAAGTLFRAGKLLKIVITEYALIDQIKKGELKDDLHSMIF